MTLARIMIGVSTLGTSVALGLLVYRPTPYHAGLFASGVVILGFWIFSWEMEKRLKNAALELRRHR